MALDRSSAGDERFGFRSTRWSRVLATGLDDRQARVVAFEDLCARYWSPVYAFIRRLGHDVHDAQDLTQAFFTQLLERDAVAQADPQRGRFRTFLKTLVRHFLSDEHTRRATLRRGGGLTFVPLDVGDAEARLATRTADESPESRFEREWALQVLHSVLDRLADEHRLKERTEQWELLRTFLTPGQAPPAYEPLSLRLGISVTALKVTVHRLRQRFRSLLRETIADTLEDPADIDDELGSLLAALRS